MKVFGNAKNRDERRNKRDVKGKCIIGLLARIMRGRNVSLEVRRGLRNSILLPTLMFGSETRECVVWK